MKPAAVSANPTFRSGSCERSAVEISRTVMPVVHAAALAPRTTAAIPSANDSPRATWSNGPSGSRRSGRCRRPCPRPARRRCARAPRRPASARWAGRTPQQLGLRRSRHLPDECLGHREPAAGASIPRVRASSIAVSTRSEPSRWRWSSAFGIRSRRRRSGARRRPGPVRRAHGPDATIPPPRPRDDSAPASPARAGGRPWLASATRPAARPRARLAPRRGADRTGAAGIVPAWTRRR